MAKTKIWYIGALMTSTSAAMRGTSVGLAVVLCVCWVCTTQGGWIDPDTPQSKLKTRNFVTGESYDLIMSDEFNKPGRSFRNGHDPMWTGLDRSDDDQTSNGRRSLQFYNSSYITTANGSLHISTTTEDTKWRGWNPYQKKYITMKRNFRSGMLQSWNKFCFTGGILEVDIQLPGRSDVGGLWPAVWLLGNLGRAAFEASTNLMWPWSYSTCDRTLQKAQEISGCDVTEHFSLHPMQGRGATEIDIVEVMAGPSLPLPIVKKNVTRPYNSMTLQIAPGIPASKRRPMPGVLPEWGFHWYPNLTYGVNTSINPFFYGTYLAPTKTSEPIGRSKEESYQADAISSMGMINDDFWRSMHRFRLEWEPGANGSLVWYIDGVKRFQILAQSLHAEGTSIPNEPSYVILNTAISTSWGFPNPPPGCDEYDCKTAEGQCGFSPGFCKALPATFKIDNVRVYQSKNNPLHTLGCNPRDYPTKRFIAAHEYRYKGPNEPHALRPIRRGGGQCSAKTPCGEGECVSKRCVCRDGWTGPLCLSPDHKNDFADWDAEEWIAYTKPFVPNFLRFALLAVGAAVAITAFFALRYRQSLVASNHAYTVIPGDDGVARNVV